MSIPQEISFSTVQKVVNKNDDAYFLNKLSTIAQDSCRAAYSLKLLTNACTGPVIRVRRDSDNTEQDFYADDTGALTTKRFGDGSRIESWVGSASAFVKTWYDQSGKGRHITQSTNASQPELSITQRFPPTNMTADTSTISQQLNGNGVYVASASTTDFGCLPYFAFEDAGDSTQHTSVRYNNNTGQYTGAVTTVADNVTYSGEWVQIRLPTQIALQKFTIKPRQDGSLWAARSPRSFVILGSNDGTTFRLLYEETNRNDWTAATKTFIVNATDSYSYYRIVARRVGNLDNQTVQGSGWQDSLNMLQWWLYASSDPSINYNGSSQFMEIQTQSFPPAAMTANTTAISGQSYGNGTYIASASASYDGTTQPFNAFNNNTTDFWHTVDTPARYNTNTGAYLVSNTTTAGGVTYSGEWLQLQLPSAIPLQMMHITPRSGLETQRSPRNFVVVGSNNGSTWNLVYTGYEPFWVASTTKYLHVGSSTAYSYYRLIIQTIGNIGQSSLLESVQIAEWKLYSVSTPIDPDRKTYSILADWSSNTVTGSGTVVEQNQNVLTSNTRASIIRIGSAYGFNGENNDTYNLVPIIANMRKRTAMICNHNNRVGNVNLYDNGTLYEGTCSAPASLNVSNQNFQIGRKFNNSEYLSGYINEVIIFNDALQPHEALLYFGQVNNTRSNIPDPVPDTFLDFHPRDNTSLHNNLNDFTDAALDLRFLQNFPNNTAVSNWNGYSQSTSANQPTYISYGGLGVENGFVRFNRTSSQHLNGGSKVFNINTNGGFTALAFMKFTGSAGSWERILDFGNGQGGVNGLNILLARFESSSTLACDIYNANTTVVVMRATNAITQDEWAVFGVRYRKSDRRVEVLKNGIVIASGTSSADITNRTLSNTYVGRSHWADAYLNADIGGLYVCDKYLTDYEMGSVAELMMYPNNAPIPKSMPLTQNVKTIGYVQYQPYRQNYAARFTGSANSHVRVNDMPSLPFSMSFWFNIAAAVNYTILGLSDDKRTGSSGVQIDYETSNNRITIYAAMPTAWTSYQINSISINTWYHLTLIFNINNTINVYLNGTLHGTITGSGTIPKYSVAYIGAAGDAGKGYKGLISDFRIYNRVLKADECNRVYDSRWLQVNNVNSPQRYLVNSINWLTQATTTQVGGYAPVISNVGNIRQLQLTSAGTTGSRNTIFYDGRIQDYRSFNISFEIYYEDIGADGLYFFFGALGLPEFITRTNGAYVVAFSNNNTLGATFGNAPSGILICDHKQINYNQSNGIAGVFERFSNRYRWLGNASWIPVSIQYNKNKNNTLVLSVNGEDVLSYSDPNIDKWLTGTGSVVRNGLVAYFDPANPSSYSGSGATLTSLVGNVTGTLGGTYSFRPLLKTYGSGTLQTSASTFYSAELPENAFNTSLTSVWTALTNNYSSTGAYTGSVSTTISDVSYSGEWLQVEFSSPRSLAEYSIFPWTAATPRAPRRFFLAGSNNGSTWEMVDSKSSITGYDSSGKSFQLATPSANYKYYRLVVNETNQTGVAGWVSISRLVLNVYEPNDTSSTIRLVNNNDTASSNRSYLQLSSVSSITTVSIWYYQHSNVPPYAFLLDMRTGGSGGWIYSDLATPSNQTGSNWSTGTLYKNGGSSQSITWSNIQTVGSWQNITVIANTAATDDITMFCKHTLDTEGLDVTFGPILVYNRAITEAENLENFNAIVGRYGNLWGIGASSTTGAGSADIGIRRLEENFLPTDVSMTTLRNQGFSTLSSGSGAVSVSDAFTKQKGLMDGLMFKIYDGFFNGDPAHFSNNHYMEIGRTNNTLDLLNTTYGSLAAASGGANVATRDTISVELLGYFRPNSTGNWSFKMSTDDRGLFWIGNNALSGLTSGNADISTSVNESTTTIALTAGQYYPIRIQYGENFVNEGFFFAFTPPGGIETSDGRGYFFCPTGNNINFPAENAKVIKDLTQTNRDGVYYINCNGVSTATYCLMNSAYDGGGWMLMMKGTNGTTFSYGSNYWSTANTLNPTDTTRYNGNAKYDVFNRVRIKDVLAIFPDIDPYVASNYTYSIRLAASSVEFRFYSDLSNTNAAGPDAKDFKRFLLKNSYVAYALVNGTVVQFDGFKGVVSGSSENVNSTYETITVNARYLDGSLVTNANLPSGSSADVTVTITPIQFTSGSINIPDGWTWKVDNWAGAGGVNKITALDGFQSNRDATPSNCVEFSGFDGRVWSQQSGSNRHIFGGGAHVSGMPSDRYVRWGMVWNNEADFITPDMANGIGMSSQYGNASAADYVIASNAGRQAISRQLRFEMYGR